MDTVFYVLVAILVLGAGGYWYFFMRKEGGKKKVDMSDGSGESAGQPADMGGEQTAAPEGEGSGNNQGGNDQPAV